MKEVPLTQGYVAMVDDGDYEELCKYKWQISTRGSSGKLYAKRGHKVNGKDVTVLMHRQIMNAPKGKVVDHRDGNGLNNQRQNFRVTTQLNNRRNSAGWSKPHASKYKGVSWFKKKWVAKISVNGAQRYLGRFENEIDAAIAYNKIAAELYGEFAKLNRIPDIS